MPPGLEPVSFKGMSKDAASFFGFLAIFFELLDPYEIFLSCFLGSKLTGSSFDVEAIFRAGTTGAEENFCSLDVDA
jgi:hypothetical protein